MIRPQRTTPTVGESSKIREEGSTSPTPTINDRKDSNNEGNSNNDGRENEQEITDGSKPPKKVIKLYKSPRLTGYLTIFLASVINFHGVVVSKLTDENHGIPSTETQRMYGYIVALVSSVVSGFVLVCHLDRWSCLADTYRDNLFAHKSRFETILDILLLLWWFMAVIIQTRVAGIAGDGKGQFNMYFSTWCCFFCAVSTLESKMIEHNWPSMKTFIKSWPHRAPGWIAILISDFFTLFWYVDVYSEYGSAGDWSNGSQKTYLDFYYKNIRNAQYELLIFVAAATLLPSAAFVFMEIFRVSSDDKKGTLETVIEAVSLFLLACAWVPTVCIATTPGGFASHIGNSWFFTWSTCFLVMETLLWFISDSRGATHQTLLQREEEYQQHQQNVLAATMAHREDGSDIEEDHEIDDDNDNDDDSLTIRIEDAPHDEKSSMEGAAVFEIKDDSENGEDLDDDSIRQEIRMKETDKHAYFDTLNDILE